MEGWFSYKSKEQPSVRLYPEHHRKKSLFVLLLVSLSSRFRPPPSSSLILSCACCSTCTMRTLELCVFTLWLCLHVSVHAFQHITFRDAYPFADSEMVEASDRIIYPGTLWCGNGNIANGTNELGAWKETDACCRTHDMCPDIIEAHGSKHGLTNPADYTRLNCECDEEFRRCLHNSGDTVSAALVGRTYFTFLRTQCFRLDYPIVRCKVKSTILRRCKEYEFDKTAPQKYQWFDVLQY